MNRRTRHILVDTIGLVLAVHVHAADVADRDGTKPLLAPLSYRFPRLAHRWADAGDHGPAIQWASEISGWALEIVRRPRRWTRASAGQDPPPMPAGLRVLPRRCVVERTFAWLGRYRRVSTDDAALTTTEDAWISLGMRRLMLARLAR